MMLYSCWDLYLNENKKILNDVIIFVAVFVVSYFLLRVSDNLGFPIKIGLVTIAFMLVFAIKRVIYWVVGFPIILLGVLYMPTAMMYGFPSEDIISALFYSNPNEASSYFQVIGAKEYVYAGTLLVFAILFGYLYGKVNQGARYKLGALGCLVLAISFFSLSNKEWSKTYPFGFIHQLNKVYTNFKSNQYDKNGFSLWKVTKAEPQYDDYVLISGESARKDYLSAYGYPYDTTPFMKAANGVLVDGLISPASSTVPSVTRMLTLTGQGKEGIEEINYRYNLIDLAKISGLKTYWISAQGKYGGSESPISLLGQKSDFHHFLKLKGNDGKGPSDKQLLPIFSAQLSQPSKKSRLFILHLFGSHFNACDRIETLDPNFHHSKGHAYNCYLSSLKETDALLEQVYTLLKRNEQQHQRCFSMIYLADHGQGQYDALRHSGDTKQGYEVPLFMTSSDSQKQIYIKANKSGFNVLHGLGSWLGIQAEGLNPKYQLFDEANDLNIKVKGDPPVLYESLKNDAAIQ